MFKQMSDEGFKAYLEMCAAGVLTPEIVGKGQPVNGYMPKAGDRLPDNGSIDADAARETINNVMHTLGGAISCEELFSSAVERGIAEIEADDDKDNFGMVIGQDTGESVASLLRDIVTSSGSMCIKLGSALHRIGELEQEIAFLKKMQEENS